MADEPADNFTLPVGIAPDVQDAPATTAIPNSSGEPVAQVAQAGAAAATAPIVATAQDLQTQQAAQDAADQAAQQKAAQQKLYSDYITHLQTGLGGMSDYIDAVGQKYPDLAARFSARLPQIQSALQDPSMTPEGARDFLNTNYDSMSKELDEVDKEAAATALEQQKQKQDLLAPKFDDWLNVIKQNPSYDADKLGRPFTANEQAVLRQSAGQLNGYKPFEDYLKGSTTPEAKPSNSNISSSDPSEQDLYGMKNTIINNGYTVENYLKSLPRRGMSADSMTKLTNALTQMVDGTYVPGSYRPSAKGNAPAPIPKAPPMNPDDGVAPNTGTAQTSAPSPKPSSQKTPNAPIPAPSTPTPSSSAIPGYSLTGDQGDANYWNNKTTKTAIANIQNARSTIANLMDVYKGLDNSRFPTWNAFINSTSPLVGAVKAKMAQLNTTLAREEVQKAMARGGIGNVEQLKLTNAMFDPNASLPQQVGGGQAMLSAIDRWEKAVGQGGGRFAGNAPPSATNAPIDPQTYTKANPQPKSNSTQDISTWLQGAGRAATPQSIQAVQKWMQSQSGM